MNNPFQEQLLKAGVVTKKQVQKAQQDKTRQNKKINAGPKKDKKNIKLSETQIKALQLADKKAERDRELNKKKEEQARQKANSIEINQLITNNKLARDEDCDIVYNFEHNKKVKRIYVNAEMKQKIIKGKLGIARIEGCYELVPLEVAEKIIARNQKRIVLFTQDEIVADADYAADEYQIPDDLVW